MVQPITSSYSLPLYMLSPRGINHNIHISISNCLDILNDSLCYISSLFYGTLWSSTACYCLLHSSAYLLFYILEVLAKISSFLLSFNLISSFLTISNVSSFHAYINITPTYQNVSTSI